MSQKCISTSGFKKSLLKIGISSEHRHELEYVYQHERRFTNFFSAVNQMFDSTFVFKPNTHCFKQCKEATKQYYIFTEHNINDFEMTKYVSNYCKRSIEEILLSFANINPIFYVHIRLLKNDIAVNICNMIMIKILANTISLIEFNNKYIYDGVSSAMKMDILNCWSKFLIR